MCLCNTCPLLLPGPVDTPASQWEAALCSACGCRPAVTRCAVTPHHTVPPSVYRMYRTAPRRKIEATSEQEVLEMGYRDFLQVRWWVLSEVPPSEECVCLCVCVVGRTGRWQGNKAGGDGAKRIGSLAA